MVNLNKASIMEIFWENSQELIIIKNRCITHLRVPEFDNNRFSMKINRNLISVRFFRTINFYCKLTTINLIWKFTFIVVLILPTIMDFEMITQEFQRSFSLGWGEARQINLPIHYQHFPRAIFLFIVIINADKRKKKLWALHHMN